MNLSEIIDKIKELKAEKNAVILAHYYSRPEVQDVADYLGDSLGLARQAEKTDADIIVFCGVHFMAETASIISPDKKVLSPVLRAGCSLADSVTGDDLRRWKERNPDGLIVSYVNTSAEVKAWSDYCCTSSNALNVVRSLPNDRQILFVPDKHLGAYIQEVTGRDMELWNGACVVHAPITAEMVLRRLDDFPEADALIHPESACSRDPRVLRHPRAYMYSTAGIIRHAKESPKRQFIVATELETIHELSKQNPAKEFIPIHPDTYCDQMKKVTLPDVLSALEQERHEVRVPEETRRRAVIPIQRMLEIG